ncbi:ATP-binding protein [Desulfopila sp. IMCC35008]|uniref:ATP-binding protein n=1 Tax=Desulfopila sp. IMCC35008 TaxID=2653858 RepID=UPI0013D79723|nr:ATP-binding protein [Desulfopila sp. IMCC35008]
MKISLHYKLFGAFLAAILAVVVYMALVMQWSFDRGFLNYVSMVEHEQLERMADGLEEYYAREKGWQGLQVDPVRIFRVIIASYPEGRRKERLQKKIQDFNQDSFTLPSGPLPSGERLPFFLRIFLLDEHKEIVVGYDPEPEHTERIDMYYQNRVVGTLGVHFVRNLSESHQLLFARKHKGVLVLVAVAGFLLAAGLSLPFSHRMTRPIRQLAAGTRALASGRYETRIRVESGDELGQLSHDFNKLAEILEKNRKSRSSWFADISHELRTPLSILQGKIEALQDGVFCPDQEMLGTLHREVTHLGRLVDDLYQLSLSDQGAMSYYRVEVEPCWALEQALDSLGNEREAKKLALEISIKVEGHITLFADNERLKQLFTNLLSNSIRYTDQGGVIRVTVESDHEKVTYNIEDSSPSVPAESMKKLFNRLYRVEGSRSRDLGGAGLGLSICRNIVTAHGGKIEAHPSPLGGLQIKVILPVSEQV